MGGSKVGLRVVGVQVVGGHRGPGIAVGHPLRLGPVNQIPGGGALNGSESCRRRSGWLLHHVAEIADVESLRLGPEDVVGGIEGVADSGGDDGLLAQPPPPEPVFGTVQVDVHEEGFLGLEDDADRLHTLGGRHPGAGVDEREKVVDRAATGLVDDGHHVVLPSVIHLQQPQAGFLPTDAVAALGVAEDTRSACGPSPVEHAKDIAVADHLVSEVEGALPRPIRLQGGSRRLGASHHQARSVQPIDQVVIDEKFQSGADVDGLPGFGLLRGGRGNQADCHERRPNSRNSCCHPPSSRFNSPW